MRLNSVTRLVSFSRTKIDGKCQFWKIQMHLGKSILQIITRFARNYRCDFFLIFQPLCIGITLRRSCIMIAAFLSRLYGSVGALQDYYSLIRISLFSSWHCQNSPSSFSPQSYLIGEITHNKPRQPQTTPVEVKKNCQLEFSRPSKLSFLWPRRRPVRLQDFEL